MVEILNRTWSETISDDQDFLIAAWKSQAPPRGLIMAGAEDSYFWDERGNRYLDFSSQYVFANLGFSEGRVINAIQEQMHTLPLAASSFVTEARARAAAAVASVTPGELDSIYFCTGGAEANEAAIKMARDITGRSLIVTRYRSYHGSTFGALSLSQDTRSWPWQPGVPGIVAGPACNPYRCHNALRNGSCPNCAEHSLDEFREVILNLGPTRIAGILVEPIVGANGVVIPPDGYFQGLRQLCDEYGILLIADEVMTGFGRTGRWFACEHWGVEPDIITMAKGLTAGYVPMGAVAIRSSLASAWQERPFIHGHTYSCHPLGCAAVSAAVSVYKEDDLVERSRVLGQELLASANLLMDRHPSVGDARGLGLFVGLELVRDRKTREPFGGDGTVPGNAKDQVLRALLDRGVFIMAGHASVLTLAPPLNVAREDITKAVDALDEVLIIADSQVVH